MKKLVVLCLSVLISVIVITGCAKTGYAIKVNGQEISRQTYNDKLNAVKSYLSVQGVDADSDPETLEDIRVQVLEGLIRTEIIHQEVVKQKWDTEDPEVLKIIEDLKSQLPNKDYRAWLAEQAMTEEEVVEFYTFVYNIGKDVTVSKQEIKQYFDANYGNYGGQDEQVKARHILVNTEQEALDIIKKLKAGADFAQLAKEKSLDEGSKDSGGELGYFTKGQMVPEFEKAAFSQAKGQIPDKPVKTKYGFHIIEVEDHKDAVIPDFNKVKDTVGEHALAFNKSQKIQSYYDKLRQEAEIEYAADLKPEPAE